MLQQQVCTLLFTSREENQANTPVDNYTYSHTDTIPMNEVPSTPRGPAEHYLYLVTEGHRAIYIQTVFTLQLQQGVSKQFLPMIRRYFVC